MDISPEKVREIQQYAREPISLDRPSATRATPGLGQPRSPGKKGSIVGDGAIRTRASTAWQQGAGVVIILTQRAG
jgi:hypothetical protein